MSTAPVGPGPGNQHGASWAEPCPSTAPTGFFRRRQWAWRSGSCAAVNHRFEVLSEAPYDLGDVFGAVTGPLRADGGPTSLSRYRVIRGSSRQFPYAMYYENSRLVLSRATGPLLRLLAWHVNRRAVAESLTDFVMLHAACATRCGQTVLLPGGEECGKTTTVAGLLREGYGYVTDEAVAIHPGTLQVTPYPKALSVDAGAWPLFPSCRPAALPADVAQWQVPAHHLGASPAGGVIRAPRLIVFPHFAPEGPTRALELTPAQAVRELVQQTFGFPCAPQRNLWALGALTRHATSVSLRFETLTDAVDAIEQLVSETLRKELTS